MGEPLAAESDSIAGCTGTSTGAKLGQNAVDDSGVHALPDAIVPSARRLAHFDNFRFMVSEAPPLESRSGLSASRLWFAPDRRRQRKCEARVYL